MRTVDILRQKRLGRELRREDIAFLIDGFTADEIPSYQMSAFLMATCLRGMSADETAALTEVMLASGSAFDFSHLPGKKIDKHSTGGVGDKTSLVIAPLAAAAGVWVPMVSGRALGHSGGTLDKLEAIPGFNVHLSDEDFRAAVEEVGCAIVGQTDNIAPADKRVYALRDVTATIDSFPLITASILSKKLAEGISGLVLDVKTGSGAFMKTQEDATQLARLMLATAARMGTSGVALITDMNQPLGHYVGNALEVEEAVQVLRGEGPADLTDLCLLLTAHMVHLAGNAETLPEAEVIVRKHLENGDGLQKLAAMVGAQGGDPAVVEGQTILARANHRKDVPATEAGFVQSLETESIGTAAMILGAGRRTVDDPIDPAAGMIVHAKLGDEVSKGDSLVTLCYNADNRLDDAERLVRRAYSIGRTPPEPLPLVRSVLTEERTT